MMKLFLFFSSLLFVTACSTGNQNNKMLNSFDTSVAHPDNTQSKPINNTQSKPINNTQSKPIIEEEEEEKQNEDTITNHKENRSLLSILDDAISFLGDDMRYRGYCVRKYREEYLKRNQDNIDIRIKDLINKLGAEGHITKVEHQGDFRLFKPGDITISYEEMLKISQKFNIIVLRPPSLSNNTKLVIGCGERAPNYAQYRPPSYEEEHLHTDVDTVDTNPIMNPKIIADITKPGLAMYIKSINKQYGIIQPEGLEYAALYNTKSINVIKEILSPKGVLLISQKSVFNIFLKKFGTYYNINKEIEYEIFDKGSIECLISKLPNNTLKERLIETNQKWGKEQKLIENKFDKYNKNIKILKFANILLSSSFYTLHLNEYFLKEWEHCIGVPIKYIIDEEDNYVEERKKFINRFQKLYEK